jgi:hypothetical protein
MKEAVAMKLVRDRIPDFMRDDHLLITGRSG